MEALREIKIAKGHRVVIDIPKRFAGREVEIIVFPLPRKSVEYPEKFENLLLSESVLKKDWDKDEEDKAWKNL